MKKIKYLLFLTLTGLHFSTYAQQKADSPNTADSLSNKLNKKELRKQKDSIAKSLTPIPDKCIVYIIRSSHYGMMIPLKLDCDSFEVGWLQSKTYLYTILDPGQHVFKASSENDFLLPVNLEAGKIYYFDQEAKMGIAYARTKIKMLDSEEGKKHLSECLISNHNRYPLYPKSISNAKDPDLN